MAAAIWFIWSACCWWWLINAAVAAACAWAWAWACAAIPPPFGGMRHADEDPGVGVGVAVGAGDELVAMLLVALLLVLALPPLPLPLAFELSMALLSAAGATSSCCFLRDDSGEARAASSLMVVGGAPHSSPSRPRVVVRPRYPRVSRVGWASERDPRACQARVRPALSRRVSPSSPVTNDDHLGAFRGLGRRSHVVRGRAFAAWLRSKSLLTRAQRPVNVAAPGCAVTVAPSPSPLRARARQQPRLPRRAGVGHETSLSFSLSPSPSRRHGHRTSQQPRSDLLTSTRRRRWSASGVGRRSAGEASLTPVPPGHCRSRALSPTAALGSRTRGPSRLPPRCPRPCPRWRALHRCAPPGRPRRHRRRPRMGIE